MGKTEQIPNCTSRTRLRPNSTSWEARKPHAFDRVLADLTAGVIDEDQPYLVLGEIEPGDAGRDEVEAFCTQLAFAELRRCLDHEMGEELTEMANEKGAVQDLMMVETSSGLKGGSDLVTVLRSKDERDFAGWQIETVRGYLDYVSKRLGVTIEVLGPAQPA